jgi:ubiquinol oxidase
MGTMTFTASTTSPTRRPSAIAAARTVDITKIYGSGDSAGRPADTAVHAAGPPTLNPARLRYEQQRTLGGAPETRPRLVLRLLFGSIDLLYGRRPSIEKFLVLEHLAQVPYRSWERVAQRHIARTRGRSVVARRIQQRVAEARAQHDNEQWHMLVMEELIVRRGRRLGRFRHRLLPRLMALPWQIGTWVLHLVRPDWSYRLNAAFEAHAEHSYMRFVALHPDTEQQIFGGPLADRWQVPVTVADVLRQIGHDERMHMLDSEQAALDASVARQDETGSDAREVA